MKYFFVIWRKTKKGVEFEIAFEEKIESHYQQLSPSIYFTITAKICRIADNLQYE
jgi:hypothetical protein